jgi:hypothetical protein
VAALGADKVFDPGLVATPRGLDRREAASP